MADKTLTDAAVDEQRAQLEFMTQLIKAGKIRATVTYGSSIDDPRSISLEVNEAGQKTDDIIVLPADDRTEKPTKFGNKTQQKLEKFVKIFGISDQPGSELIANSFLYQQTFQFPTLQNNVDPSLLRALHTFVLSCHPEHRP